MAELRQALGRAPDFFDDAVEALEVDRFDEVCEKAGLPGASEVFVHPVTAERNPSEAILASKLDHEIDAVSVRPISLMTRSKI